MPEIKAYSVQETCEGTGGIVFAKHNVVARRIGARRHGDGDFDSVTCHRAPWADRYAEDGHVPASAAIEAGWWFECAGCGRRINEDLPNAWAQEMGRDEPLRGQQLLYARWRPDHIIGYMDTAVFCRKACKVRHDRHEAERERRQNRAIDAFKRIILKRFPDAAICDNVGDDEPYYRRHHHAYATTVKGRWRVKQIKVAFAFPGMKIAPASLEYNPQSYDMREHRKPAFRCCNGDKEAFEAWAASGREASA
ncbi:hypothetical protein [Sphingobium sp. CFD-2]|uniref:hypothetical protein n=1 Tax=Sphingobium sp. CFD-2 TaxID=2878542 RepID=UPI00214CF2A4|nr:hypothetical protein [Sphingobium sp. CFD-2]